ncbi:MAG: A/G-specific adenine glycosylase [Raineya sp.]|nr:A/G-specific adenine glycosylase [Raineya sp.]
MQTKSEIFVEKIIAWYQVNQRKLPWRATKNPYYIWLSEIILQQTRVKQGLRYYQKFIETYPTLQDLANASESEVFRLWQGLGYYNRAKNMLATARYLCEHCEGKFPQTYKELLTLKGIGKYTAAAIASFAFNEQVAVLDGNVYRVLARYFGIYTDIASLQGEKEFRELAQSLVPTQASEYNQAIMEFGALQCTPQKPNCMFCPLQENCFAFAYQEQANLPVKISKLQMKERFFAYIVWHKDDKIAMKKRSEKDIWENLYDFELQEKNGLEELHSISTNEGTFLFHSDIFKHQLTHQRIFIRFFHFEATENSKIPHNLTWHTWEEIQHLPKPIVIVNYLQSLQKTKNL